MSRPRLAPAAAVLLTAFGLAAPMAPAQRPDAEPAAEPADANPMASARTARHLLRNGQDYIAYRQYERALSYLREAEANQKSLTQAEKAALRRAIERARQGMREPENGPEAVARADRGRTPRASGPGTFALARRTPGPAVTPSPVPAPIQLAGATVTSARPDAAAESAATAVVERADAAELAAIPAPESLPPLPLAADPIPAPAPLGLTRAPAEPRVDPPAPPAAVAAAEPVAPPVAPAPVEPVAPAQAPPAPEPVVDLPALPEPAGSVIPVSVQLPIPAPMPAPAPAPAAKPVAVPAPAAPAEIAAVEPLDLSPAPEAEPEPAVAEPLTPAVPAPAETPAPAPAETPAPAPASPAEPAVVPAPPAPAPAPAEAAPAVADPTPAPGAAEAIPDALPELPPEAPARPEPAPAQAPRIIGLQAAPIITSTLPEASRRAVEEIARLQEAESRRATDAAPTNRGDQPTGGGDSQANRLELPRAPSPTEARPIRPIPVPEEFTPMAPRRWDASRKFWAAPATCHGPLYFQDAVLERYGQSVEQAFGPAGRFLTYPLDDVKQSNQRMQILQPAVSLALFYGQVLAWPYNLLVDPPWEAEYDLGYHRPGDRIPPDTYYLPWLGVGPPFHGRNYGGFRGHP